MNRKDAVPQEDNGQTVDFSVNTKITHEKALHDGQEGAEVTVGFDATEIQAKETEIGRTGIDGATIEHTPAPTLAKGVIPETPVVDRTNGGRARGANVDTADSSKSRRISSRKHGPSLVGRTIGDYRIDSELGRGGMGVVYRGHHQKLKRDVAIKMILGAGATDRQSLERFEIEARAVASLQHPNFVQLFEFGSFDESPFFALEFIDGGTLADRIKETPLAPIEAAKIVEAMARAMQIAHDQGILHRDLKPANVMLTADDSPKITDFGLAKELTVDSNEETKAGTVMGTPSFMSPEQAMGNISELTGATDQYSLGAILYACISGRPPFIAASTIDTISQVVSKEPVPPRQLSATIPIDLETICLKTLHKDAVKRYPSCEELANDLRRYVNGEPIIARPISKLERSWRWCKRNPRVAIPSSLAGIFIILTAGVSSWAWATTAAQAAIITQERDNVKSQRDEAEKQRDESRRQKIIADQQKAVAEDNERIARKQANLALKNIQFVLTEVDTELSQQPGMSGVRIGILESVSERWDELEVELTGGVRGEAIPTLMAVRQKIAITFQDLDRLKEAMTEFSKLEEMARERIAVKGRNDATRSNLAKILLASAPLSRRLDNDPDAGLQKFDEAKALVREILTDPQPEENSPTENEILQLLGAVTQNQGVEYLREGRIADTEQAFTEALDANSQVMANIRNEPGFDELNEDQRDTKTAGLQMEIDRSRIGLAYIRLRLGKTEESIPLYDEAIAARREIFERRPNMLIMKSELAGYLKIYGKSLLWLDRLDEAAPMLREAVKLSDEAWQADPEKVSLKRALAESLYIFGALRVLQSQPDEALALFERSRLLRAELAKVSPDEKNRKELMLAEAAVGNEAAAKELIDTLGEVTKANGELHLERARSLGSLAAQAEGGKRDQFESEALAALERAVEEGFLDPFRINVEPELVALRDEERFQRVVQTLKEKQHQSW